MYPKLFILKEFYFLILKSNVGPHYKYCQLRDCYFEEPNIYAIQDYENICYLSEYYVTYNKHSQISMLGWHR